jgi:hypothetical protein
MHECKLIKVPIPVGVKLSRDQCPKTEHCPCSWSFEQVYVKTREGALDNCKEGFQVFTWHYRLCDFLPRKTWTKHSVRCTWLC